MLSVLAASFQASLYATQKAVQELKVSIRQLEDKVSEFKQEVDAFEKQKEEIRNDHRDQQRISEEMDREREKFSEVNEKEEVVKEYHSLLSLLVQMVNSIQNDSNHDDIWDTLNEISQSMMQLGKEGAMYFGCSAGEEKTKQVRRLKGIVDKFL